MSEFANETGGGTDGETKSSSRFLSFEHNQHLLDQLENQVHQMEGGRRSDGSKRYKLLAYLGGRQGKSAVYKALDTRIGTNVALKFIGAQDDATRRRFRREISMLTISQHENIIAAIKDEPLKSSDNSLWVGVLEYIGGLSIDQSIQQISTMGFESFRSIEFQDQSP